MAQTEGMEERIIRTEVRVEEHGKTFEMMNTRFGSLENRVDSRIGSLENRVDSRIDGMENKMDARENRMNTRIDKLENRIDTNFRWMIGIQITMWITIILAILFKS